eukprot:scaffold1272_cov250-Pinguiococcus_pyrenoidosus.AAC.68
MIKLVRDLLNRLKAAESVFKDALQLSMPPKHDARVHPIHPASSTRLEFRRLCTAAAAAAAAKF